MAHGVTAGVLAGRYGRWIASRQQTSAEPLPELEEQSELRPARGRPGRAARLRPSRVLSRVAVARRLDAIPLVGQIRAYERPWLSRDVLAALAVWALLVPQALAYGQLAGSIPS